MSLKIFIMRVLRALKLEKAAKAFYREIKGGVRCVKMHGLPYTVRLFCLRLAGRDASGIDKEPRIKAGLSKVRHEPELIVSLTSYPARINTVHKTIDTILRQTERPDRIILWLAPEQFPKKNRELPKKLKRLGKFGLEIAWYHDIKSYKKLIPTLKKYPEAIIVTADDDAYYHSDWLKGLYASYKKHPYNIHCHRATKFYYEDGEYKWVSGGKDKYICPSYLHKPVGLGGVLYPPHSLHEDALKEELFTSLAKTNDDQWFWFMAVLNNYKIMVVENNVSHPKYIEGTQNGECPHKINDMGPKLFRQDLQNLLFHYPQVAEKLRKDYDFVVKYEALAKKPNEEKNYDFNKNLPIEWYEAAISEYYHRRTGGYLNLDKPVTYNEKIQWLKLYDATELKTRLADKYLVRHYVREKIGDEYLIPMIGIYDSFDEIYFSSMPDSFVMKTNHGCKWMYVVRDKKNFDIQKARVDFNLWMSMNYAYVGMEMQYKNIPPKIVVEEYLENDNGNLNDYKLFCFDGKVNCISFLSERARGLKNNFYDTEWNPLPFTHTYPKNKNACPKPEKLKELCALAEKLACEFSFVRVDFYILNNGQIKFGELTFSPSNGMCKWDPPEQNEIFGNLIKLPEKSHIPMPEQQN